MKRPLLLLALTVPMGLVDWVACGSHRANELPNVHKSSTASPSRSVTVGPSLQYAPACVEITPGQTVEWGTQVPNVPVNVTSVSSPLELYSPDLQTPLDCPNGDGICWRHTFAAVGCFEYYDTNSGTGTGRVVVDPVTGESTLITNDNQLTTGIVCVRDGQRCTGLCCDKVEDCPTDGTIWSCVSRRCVDLTRNQPRTCAAYVNDLTNAGQTL